MPREIRQIILSKDEFIGAIKSYKRTSPAALPHGDVTSYTVDSKGTLQLDMKTYYGGGQQKIQISLDGKHVIQILVRFCIENNIMLPMKSNKTYKSINDEFVLMIEIDM